MLDSYRFYEDLIMEIEVLELQIESAIQERENWHFMNKHRIGKHLPLDEVLIRMDTLAERIEWLTERIEDKKKLRRNIQEKLNGFEGLEYKVAYLRIVQGKRLEDIAEELGYSVDWIKKVSATVTKHLESTDIVYKTM
ncbi:hypothetical protein BN1080_02082 [Planococcus massiliensis]|uniref:Uncharacterized protein n=2 Tax=Planococcus massiliensis TaxID=1499687 RepID=A0A098ELH1_9BACL|nr:hypothetical protein BN1080_02082 [Planococcus massiliensis]